MNGRRGITKQGLTRESVLTIVLLSIIVVTILGGCANRQAGERISDTRLLLDTFVTITIHGDSDPGLLDEAFALCEEYEALLSITREGSDVWRINHAEGEPVSVDPNTLEVIMYGLDFGEFTDGMFDITIGRVSRLWDFSSVGDTGVPYAPKIPSDADLEAALFTVDYRQVLISGNTVQLADPEAWIDLGAIAKGYIGDRIAGFLVERGVSNALINLGGDVVVVGNRQDGNPWRIALQKPLGNEGERLGVFEISDASVISSGIYERRFEIDGVLYHHILDPNTGMPSNSDVVSATVIASSAVIGEGLSTTAVLTGSERARVMFEQVPEAVGMVLVLENGELLQFGNVRLVD